MVIVLRAPMRARTEADPSRGVAHMPGEDGGSGCRSEPGGSAGGDDGATHRRLGALPPWNRCARLRLHPEAQRQRRAAGSSGGR